MRSVYYVAMSLDGYIAGPNDELDWWLALGQSEQEYLAFYKRVGAVVMGANTYLWLYQHFEQQGKEWPLDIPVSVLASRPLPRIAGVDIWFGTESVQETHRRAAAISGGKDLWVLGGGGLASQFLANGLLDDVVVQVAPVILGAGKRVFGDALECRELVLTRVREVMGIYGELHYEVRSPQNCQHKGNCTRSKGDGQ